MAEFFNPEGTNQTPAKVTPIHEKPSIRQNPFYQAIVTDIMIPTAMNTIYDIGHSLLNRFCYGSFSSRRGGYRAGRGEAWTSYDAYYKEDKRRTEGTVVAVGAKNRSDPYRGNAAATIYPFADLAEIDVAMDEMTERLMASGKLTVADMYDIAQISGMPVTANDFGWTELSKVKRSRDPLYPDRWVIVMPKPFNVRNI